MRLLPARRKGHGGFNASLPRSGAPKQWSIFGNRIGLFLFKDLDRPRALKAFTLIETMVVALILGVIIFGMLGIFIYMAVIPEMTSNKTLALAEAQSKIEEIRNHDYSLITTDYASGGTLGNVFVPAQLEGRGFVFVDSSNTGFLVVYVSIGWRDSSGRVYGEDVNLDGVLSVAEDTNSNGRVDSPVSLVTMIAQR